LPKYEQASLPAGQYYTTEFEPSLTFRITGDDWIFEGPSGVLGDPEHPDYLFIGRASEGDSVEIAFFNVRKVEGVYKPKGPTGAIEPVPSPDELVGWFRPHPYLKISEPEPATVGGVEGVQFDVVANLPKDYSGISLENCCVDIFALSTGGSSQQYYLNKTRYILLKNVKGTPVVIYSSSERWEFDEGLPKAEQMLDSVRWIGT
jgi:hypothetical protein